MSVANQLAVPRPYYKRLKRDERVSNARDHASNIRRIVGVFYAATNRIAISDCILLPRVGSCILRPSSLKMLVSRLNWLRVNKHTAYVTVRYIVYMYIRIRGTRSARGHALRQAVPPSDLVAAESNMSF